MAKLKFTAISTQLKFNTYSHEYMCTLSTHVNRSHIFPDKLQHCHLLTKMSFIKQTEKKHINTNYQIKSNQMSLPNVRFAVKTTSVTPPSITGRYQCTTQADRDVGYREWFKTVPAIYHEINMNERMN